MCHIYVFFSHKNGNLQFTVVSICLWHVYGAGVGAVSNKVFWRCMTGFVLLGHIWPSADQEGRSYLTLIDENKSAFFRLVSSCRALLLLLSYGGN